MDVGSDDPIDMATVRSSLELNCRRYAAHPEGAALAMDLFLTLRRTALVYQILVDRYTREFGLSPAKIVVLMALAASEGQSLTQSAIGRQMSMSLGNLTALIRSLEGDGIVRRRPDRNDGRVYHVALTAAGRRLVSSVAPAHFGKMETALGGLDADQQRTLVRSLDAMRASLRREKGN